MIPVRVFLRGLTGCQLASCWVTPVKHPAIRPLHMTAVCCASKSKKYPGSGNSKPRGDVDPDLKEAVQSVADSLPGDAEKTASDLLSQLRVHAASSSSLDSKTKDSKPVPSLGDLFSGMKIETSVQTDRQKSPLKPPPRSWQPHSREDDNRNYSRKALFEAPALGIFARKTDKQEVNLQVTDESLWDVVEREELEQLTKTPPTNSFEEMIQLTKEGKLWHFPISNEQGMDEEAKYEFQDHVFFDDLLEDFPQKGPIRHFMELVTTGLSKNPYMTVPQKREHIMWFRDYFKDKEHILEEAIDSSNAQ